MNRIFLVLSLVLLGLPTLTAVAQTPNKPLKVMLQGESAMSMRALVEQEQGKLTHYLPIINAIGAEVSPHQLDNILATGKVNRVIDDLSNEEVEQPEEDKPCDVGGALELSMDKNQLHWRLFNKRDKSAQLKTLTATWPEQLGKISQIKIGDNEIEPSTFNAHHAGNLELTIANKSKASLTGVEVLNIQFEAPSIPISSFQQRDFDIELTFWGDCETASIPGYEDNKNDFYYSTVAGADSLHKHQITGKGITVAIVDSGLWEAPALATDTSGATRVLARYDAITNSLVEETFDESGHGTHLSSVLAHNGRTIQQGEYTGSYKGIAPDVNLIAIKSFNIEGQGDLLDIVRGIQWAVDHREQYNIRILNLSFASRPRWPYWLDPVNQAVMQAWAAGIVVVAAAGNEGPGPMTIGSPGNLPYIITVGAVTDSWTVDTRSDDYIPDFSSRGPTPEGHIKPDLVAPGGHMIGITRPGSTLTKENPEYQLKDGEYVMTGSSQAAALVSGLTALMLQLEPQLTPDQVKCKFTSSSEPAINADGLLSYSPFEQGAGYVNVVRAITLGDTECANQDMDIQKDIANIEHYEGPATVDTSGQPSLPGLDKILSPNPSAKGYSETRVWGAKEHIERLPEGTNISQLNWQQIYDQEKARIELLQNN